MRKCWATLIHEKMKEDKDIVVITADMGYGILDNIRDDFPNRFYNAGIAEQLAVNMAIGMAIAGKKPWIYGIITFQFYKALSQIRDYIIPQNLPVKFCLVGKDKTYGELDHSHWALEDKEIAHAIGFRCFEPQNSHDLTEAFTSPDGTLNLIESGPCYIRLP